MLHDMFRSHFGSSLVSAGCNGQGGAVEGTEESETEKAKGERQPEKCSE